MKRIALFLLIAVVAVSSAEAQKVKRKKQKERDGFSWYLLKQGDFQGAENSRGITIIPLENKFSSIKYRNGYFMATYGFTEIYDTIGNVIIPKNKFYGLIFPTVRSVGGNKITFFTMDYFYKWGICNQNGVEILPPKYDHYLDVMSNGTIFYTEYYGDTKEFYYTGYKFDEQGNIVPDPNHPIDTTDSPIEKHYEHTAYNNSSIGSYNNTYTPPAQHKQQSTSNKSNNNSTTQPKSSASSSSSALSSSKPSSSSNRPSHNKTTASSFQQQKVKCGQCRGTGMTNCWSCGGKGTIRKSGIDKNGKQVFRNERCTGCNGSGKRKCTVCNGKGVR